VHFHEPLHQRQPDSEPALRALERAVGLREKLEDRGQDLGRDADAVVGDADHEPVVARVASIETEPPRGVNFAAL
jgi:hypothetical protein